MQNKKIQRHNERMQRHKKIVDANIERADIERGIVLVLTGNGKGKTTSALGTLLRSLGHGHYCAMAQFIKGQWDCGETRFFAHTERLTSFSMKTGFTWNSQDFTQDKLSAETVWQQILPFFSDPKYRLIVLDEITYMFKYKYLELDDLVEAINNRPEQQNVIITGRAAPEILLELADTVSEVKATKHAFNQGIKAQEGIEW